MDESVIFWKENFKQTIARITRQTQFEQNMKTLHFVWYKNCGVHTLHNGWQRGLHKELLYDNYDSRGNKPKTQENKNPVCCEDGPRVVIVVLPHNV